MEKYVVVLKHTVDLYVLPGIPLQGALLIEDKNDPACWQAHGRQIEEAGDSLAGWPQSPPPATRLCPAAGVLGWAGLGLMTCRL